MKLAFLFPGQGAQKVGMGLDLHDTSASAKTVFNQADDALGESLSKLVFEGPQETLTKTANTQPAILTMSIACLQAFREKTDVVPDFVAGHSLGEFSALVAAGALDLGDAVRLTRARGTFMQEAVPEGQGAMAAIMGDLSTKAIGSVCETEAQGEIVSAANFNAPGQVVISGHQGAVKRASDALSNQGARVIPLQVSAPFHCALMKPAATRLKEALADIEFHQPSVPVVSNVEATANDSADQIPDLLVRQVTAPVRWTDSIQTIIDAGVTTFFEFGPGNVLAGLMRRINRDLKTVSVNSKDGLDKALAALEKL